MRITVLCEDERSLSARECLEKEPFVAERAGDMIILPIPTTRDKRRVEGSGASLLSVASELKLADIAVGYGLPEEFSLACALRGAVALDIALDESYQQEGAYLTALGLIKRLLTEHSLVPSELSFGVIGYGRIGKILSEMLLSLGATLCVYSAKELKSEKFRRLPYEALSNVQNEKFDFLINTAPARLIPDGAITNSCSFDLIELASGDNLPLDAGAIKLMQLPMREFPKSAGRAVARSVIRSLISSMTDGAKL